MHVGMTLKPAIAFRLVRVEIVEDDVNLAAGMVADDLIHEVEKLSPAAALVMTGLYGSAEHIKSRKKRRGSVAFIAVREAGERALPLGSRIQPCARSSAWIAGFSSTLKTSAFSGGFKYSPTTSAALAANSGSVEMHQLRRR